MIHIALLSYLFWSNDDMPLFHFLKLTRLFPFSSRHADKDFTWLKLFFRWSGVNMLQTAIMFCLALSLSLFFFFLFFFTLLWSFHEGKTIHQINSMWSTTCLLQSNLYKHLGVIFLEKQAISNWKWKSRT